MLGGLIQDDVRESEQKVPLLGDIPFLGALFRYKNTSKVKSNLLVFIRPTIVRDDTMSSQITQRKYDYIRSEQQRFNEKGALLVDRKDLPVFPELLELPPAYEPLVGHRPNTDSKSDQHGDSQ